MYKILVEKKRLTSNENNGNMSFCIICNIQKESNIEINLLDLHLNRCNSTNQESCCTVRKFYENNFVSCIKIDEYFCLLCQFVRSNTLI